MPYHDHDCVRPRASAAAVQRIASCLAVPAACYIVRFHHVPLRFAGNIDMAHPLADDAERIAQTPRRTALPYINAFEHQRNLIMLWIISK